MATKAGAQHGPSSGNPDWNLHRRVVAGPPEACEHVALPVLAESRRVADVVGAELDESGPSPPSHRCRRRQRAARREQEGKKDVPSHGYAAGVWFTTST